MVKKIASTKVGDDNSLRDYRVSCSFIQKMVKSMLWPTQLYTAVQSRTLDARAIATGVSAYSLMSSAGLSAFNILLRQWALPNHIHVVCGVGNNGGDGLVLAKLAKQRELAVSVYLCGDKNKLTAEAAQALAEAEQAGVLIKPFSADDPLTDGVIVDALLGIGLNGQVREQAASAIAWMNQAGLPILALDIPSGLCADTGCIMGDAVVADMTISFIAAKRGLFTGEGASVSGQVLLDDLAVPASIFDGIGETIKHHALKTLLGCFSRRPRNAHKGLFGHVLIIGGDYGMAGAAVLAAEAAARAGAGLVSVATRPEHVCAMLARAPEIMVHGVASGQALDPLLVAPSIIVIGPGLGLTPWSEQILQKALASNKPLVIDADALNLLSKMSVRDKPKRDNWVLTPHPGEAARLLRTSTEVINQDRFKAVVDLQKRFGGVVVLKGAGSLVRTENETSLCSYGNPGMSSGGMGDLLSGIIGSLLAQHLPATTAVPLAVSLHAKAADKAAESFGERGLLATDLLTPMRYLLNGKN